MLVVTRKTDDSILIEVGEQTIEVVVLETGKDKVKLGVNAPREFKIMRSELVAAKTANVEASQAVSKEVLDALLKFMK